MPEKERKRLDSWKEIAEYLCRDVATVFRWEKEKGLPVHRAPGGRRKVVFAYQDEIDSWLSSAGNKNLHTDLEQSSALNGRFPASLDDSSGALGRDTMLAKPPEGASAPTRRLSEKMIRWLSLISVVCILVMLALTSLFFLGRRRIDVRTTSNTTTTGLYEPPVSQYDFEDGEQGWVVRPKMMISKVFSSDAHSYEGKRSLAIVFGNPYARKSQVYVRNPPVGPGRAITAHIWCPAKNELKAIAFFVEDRDYTWSNDWQAVPRLIPGGWNKFVVRVPSDAPMPLSRLGIEFTANAAWKGTCYLDAVDW